MYINIYKHTCRRNLLNRSEQRSHGKMQKQSNKRHLKKKAIVSLGRHQDFSRNNFLDSACIAILSNLRRKFVKLQFQYQYQWNNLNSFFVDPQYFKIVWTVWTTNTSSYLLDSDNIMAIISYGWLLAGRHIACWAIWHLLDIVAYAPTIVVFASSRTNNHKTCKRQMHKASHDQMYTFQYHHFSPPPFSGILVILVAEES